jgi:hypothetical protein
MLALTGTLGRLGPRRSCLVSMERPAPVRI